MRNRRRARIKHNRHLAEVRIIGSKRATKSDRGVGLIKPHAAATTHRFRGEKRTNTYADDRKCPAGETEGSMEHSVRGYTKGVEESEDYQAPLQCGQDALMPKDVLNRITRAVYRGSE